MHQFFIFLNEIRALGQQFLQGFDIFFFQQPRVQPEGLQAHGILRVRQVGISRQVAKQLHGIPVTRFHEDTVQFLQQGTHLLGQRAAFG